MAIKTYLTGIFVSGFICSAAMIFSGKGALKEPVRICCACIMTIVFLTPLSKGIRVNKNVSLNNNMEKTVSDALLSAEKEKDGYVQEAFSKHLSERTAKEGINCNFLLTVNNGEVTSIIVECEEKDKENIESILKKEYALSGDKAVWRFNEN